MLHKICQWAIVVWCGYALWVLYMAISPKYTSGMSLMAMKVPVISALSGMYGLLYSLVPLLVLTYVTRPPKHKMKPKRCPACGHFYEGRPATCPHCGQRL